MFIFRQICLYLGKLSAIIEDYESSKVGIIGDFNAAVGTTFEGELLEICTHHELIISDYEHFGRNSSQFTFVLICLLFYLTYIF